MEHIRFFVITGILSTINAQMLSEYVYPYMKNVAYSEQFPPLYYNPYAGAPEMQTVVYIPENTQSMVYVSPSPFLKEQNVQETNQVNQILPQQQQLPELPYFARDERQPMMRETAEKERQMGNSIEDSQAQIHNNIIDLLLAAKIRGQQRLAVGQDQNKVQEVVPGPINTRSLPDFRQQIQNTSERNKEENEANQTITIINTDGTYPFPPIKDSGKGKLVKSKGSTQPQNTSEKLENNSIFDEIPTSAEGNAIAQLLKELSGKEKSILEVIFGQKIIKRN